MARLDLRKLEEAKARLGEAVVDPGYWVPLMETICSATGTLGAALLQSDNRTPDVPITPSCGDMFRSYFENNLHVSDVRAAGGVPLLLAGRTAVRDQDLFRSEREMARDPLYANLSRFGCRWWCAVSFYSGSALWGLALQRSINEGMFDDEEMKALAALSQSMTEAATLSHTVGRQVLLGSLNAFALINEPALAISAAGSVIDGNAKAAELFDAEFGIRNGRLHLRDGTASRALDQIIYGSLSEFGLRLKSRSRTGNTIVARRESRKPILIKALPVQGAARSPFLGARFILLLRDLERERKAAADMVAEIFSLSPAEAKVAAMVAAGSSPEEIADTMTLSRETVRNQIKSVFAKTGTHRQNELAALIARIQG